MKKSFITGIIVLLTLSLVGIIILQGLWINNAWQTKQEDFDRGVKEALNNVVQRIEKHEAVSFINEQYPLPAQQEFFFQSGSFSITSLNSRDSVFFQHDPPPLVRRVPPDAKGDSGKNVVSVLTMSDTNELRYAVNDPNHLMVGEVSLDSGSRHTIENRIKKKASQLNDVFFHMVMEWSNVQVPIERRIQPAELYQLIRQELNKKGINLPFQFAVATGQADSICTIKSSTFDTKMVPASFRTELFPNDIFFSPYQLLLHFNDMRPYFIKSLWWMLVLSVIFLMMIVATFSSAIYIILKQKKVSEIKTDFINNMTHEFKTPIATISVALDAINNPKVLNDKERVRYYSAIIGNENKRMNTHVENILQMALLDKENFELNEQLLDLHDIIQRAADQVRLQIESRGGKLTLELNAQDAYVVADEIHLTNVIYNLIDNANKYSPQSPDITVRTENREGGIAIIVEDKGIGMSAETQRRIFEKFYREQNGNVHNVKGFGLGLAYVKSIVKKHGGSIRVNSEPGAGTRFEVFLPFGHVQSLNSPVDMNGE